MTKQVIKNRRQSRRTTVFARIMIRLSFPLFFLGALFTGIQLTQQISSMNEFYRIESRFAFESVQKILSGQMKGYQSDDQLPALKKKLEALEGTYRVKIDLFNLLDRAPLPPSKPENWNDFDYKGIEEGLFQKQLGKPYQVRVDKKAEKLIAYIPLQGGTGNQVFIARVIFSLASVKDALIQSQWILASMLFFIALAGIVIGHALAQSIVKPIRTLNEATRAIVQGKLGKRVEIHTGDEIEALANAFNLMSESLTLMKSQAEDANPLTQLPGNQGILNELRQRILEKQKFVLFHIDLDRFKTFNDHYGLARGDEAIKRTADLLKHAVAEKGRPSDFVGHQGGDDFVVICQPGHAQGLAENILKRFDEEIVKSLYRKEDFERGYTLAPDRRSSAVPGQEIMVKFPLLAISLAGVSNLKKDFADYFDCMGAAARVKKEVKKVIASSYLIQE